MRVAPEDAGVLNVVLVDLVLRPRHAVLFHRADGVLAAEPRACGGRVRVAAVARLVARILAAGWGAERGLAAAGGLSELFVPVHVQHLSAQLLALSLRPSRERFRTEVPTDECNPDTQ